jgi:hypothetical protein
MPKSAHELDYCRDPRCCQPATANGYYDHHQASDEQRQAPWGLMILEAAKIAHKVGMTQQEFVDAMAEAYDEAVEERRRTLS